MAQNMLITRSCDFKMVETVAIDTLLLEVRGFGNIAAGSGSAFFLQLSLSTQRRRQHLSAPGPFQVQINLSARMPALRITLPHHQVKDSALQGLCWY
ncbi:hypothetical protein ABPG75_010184 [Micractinium tetrahymenae]